jgi:hypothetical protein
MLDKAPAGMYQKPAAEVGCAVRYVVPDPEIAKPVQLQHVTMATHKGETGAAPVLGSMPRVASTWP